MSVSPLKATASMLVVIRSRMDNQQRLDNLISEADAWTLVQDAKIAIDTRRLAAHRLLDIAFEREDSKLVSQVAKLLHKEAADVRCFGLLDRLARQELHASWQKWATERRTWIVIRLKKQERARKAAAKAPAEDALAA